MVSTASNYPTLGIAEREPGKPHILLLERIRPFDVEMVYSMLHWWRELSGATVSVVNIWPLDTYAGIPANLDLTQFDAIVLFPRLTYDPVALAFLDRRLPTSFRQYDGVKVLMRQDEHHMTRFTEDFLIDEEFDLLLSCVPQDQVPVAYPRLAQHGITVHTMLTGYVTPDMRSFPDPSHADRRFDISYRAYRGAWAKGDLVYEKYRIGIDAQRHFADFGLNLDISLEDGDRLVGDAWRQRLRDSRAVLGTESGSNLFDFDGSAYRWSMAFEHQHRESGLREHELYAIARDQLHHLEDNVRYAQISPRHLEAAASGCMQLLFPGEYSGIFEAGRHYLELRPDFSNVSEIAEQVRDADLHREMTTRAFEEIVLNPALSIESALEQLDALVMDAIASRTTRTRSAHVTSEVVGAATALRFVFDGRTPLGDHLPTPEQPGGPALELVNIRLDASAQEATAPQFGVARIDLSIERSPGSSTAGQIPEELESVAQRLAEFGDLDPVALTAQLGAYDSAYGTARTFAKDCRTVRRAMDAFTGCAERGVRPAAVIASDPQSVAVAACLALSVDASLLLDFDGLTHRFDSLPGWQSSFWQRVVTDAVANLPSVRAFAGSLSACHNAITLVGIEPERVGPSERSADHAWRSTDISAWRGALAPLLHPAGDAESRQRAALSGASPEEMRHKVLPRIADTYGPESARWWGSVRALAAITFRRDGDRAGVTVWLEALDRLTAEALGEKPGSSLRLQLDERRIAAFIEALRVAGDAGTDLRLDVIERLIAGDVPFNAESRRLGWNLLAELRDHGCESHDRLFDHFVRSGLATSPAVDADDVRGLLAYLGHYWTLGALPSALPAAEQLAVIHASEAGERIGLDVNVLARIDSVRRAAAAVDPTRG